MGKTQGFPSKDNKATLLLCGLVRCRPHAHCHHLHSPHRPHRPRELLYVSVLLSREDVVWYFILLVISFFFSVLFFSLLFFLGFVHFGREHTHTHIRYREVGWGGSGRGWERGKNTINKKMDVSTVSLKL